jgi:Protein of unknown function (DUF1360)
VGGKRTRSGRVRLPLTYFCSILSTVPIWLTVLLLVLATHRVTRVITRDAIPLVATPRNAFVNRWGRPADAQTREQRRTSFSGKRTNGFTASLAYLWECDWCASVWVGGVLAVLTNFHGDNWWWQAGLVAAAASSVTGLIAQREPD